MRNSEPFKDEGVMRAMFWAVFAWANHSQRWWLRSTRAPPLCPNMDVLAAAHEEDGAVS